MCLIAFPSQFSWAMHSFHHSRPRREAFGHLSGAVSFRVWRFTLSGDVRGMAAAESKTELVQAFSRDDVLAHSLQLPHVSQFMLFPGSSQANDWMWWRHQHPPCLPHGGLLECPTLPHSPPGCPRLGIICTVAWDIPCSIFLPPLLHRIGSTLHSEGFPCPVLPPPPLFFCSYCPAINLSILISTASTNCRLNQLLPGTPRPRTGGDSLLVNEKIQARFWVFV